MPEEPLWRNAVQAAIVNTALSVPSRRLRQLFVRRVLRWPAGEDVLIGRSVKLQNARGLTLGSRVLVNHHTELDLRGGITIGDDVDIAAHCRILTADHDPDAADRAYRVRPVVIGSRVWLATGVTVLPGTVIGDGCVVAAGSVVHGRLEPFTVYAGNPAKPVRARSRGAQTVLDVWLQPLN